MKKNNSPRSYNINTLPEEISMDQKEAVGIIYEDLLDKPEELLKEAIEALGSALQDSLRYYFINKPIKEPKDKKIMDSLDAERFGRLHFDNKNKGKIISFSTGTVKEKINGIL